MIVDIESLYDNRPYFLGLTRNISYDGFAFESQNYDLMPGDILQFTLKHPRRDISVKVNGRLVWKNETGSECITGVRFINLDDSTKGRIFELISCGRSSTVLDHTEQIRYELSFKEEIKAEPPVAGDIEPSFEGHLLEEEDEEEVEERLEREDKDKKPSRSKARVMAYLLFLGLAILLTCILILTFTNPDFKSLRAKTLKVGQEAIAKAGNFMYSILKKDQNSNLPEGPKKDSEF